MSVRVLYFAGLRESMGRSSEAVALPPGVNTLGALRDHLVSQGAPWTMLGQTRNLKVALNQAMVGPESPVKDGDEVAFFPPVTGG